MMFDAETDASGTVSSQAAWTLQSGQPASGTLTQQAALENLGAAAQAAALSCVLGALADRIAASVVARLQAGNANTTRHSTRGGVSNV